MRNIGSGIYSGCSVENLHFRIAFLFSNMGSGISKKLVENAVGGSLDEQESYGGQRIGVEYFTKSRKP